MGTLKDSPGSINVPIQCGGIVVNPGDIVVGDDDGVVVIPKDQAIAVLEKAMEIVKKEEDIRRQMDLGFELFDILGLEGIFDSYFRS